MASIKERNGSFQVRWQAGRAGRREVCTFPTIELAEAAQRLADARNHRITDREVYAAIYGWNEEDTETVESPLMKDFVEEWIANKVDVKDTTKAEYARMLRKRVIPSFEGLYVHEITRQADIDPWKTYLCEDLEPAGVHKHWTVLNMVMRAAVPRYRPDNPLDIPAGHRSNGLPRIEKHDAVFLTSPEADILVARCPPAIRDLVEFAIGTGMRQGELFGLRVKAVDLSGSKPVVYVVMTLHRGGKFGKPKSERSRRAIHLSPRMAELAARLIAGKRPNDLVFTAPEGGAWDANDFRWQHWRYAVSAAQRCAEHPPVPQKTGNGAELERVTAMSVSTCACKTRLHKRPRFHDLRHTHVALLLDAGADFYMIQLRLGHASIKTTIDVYGHRIASGDDRLLEALDRRLPGGKEKSSKKKAKRKSKKRVSPYVDGLPLALAA
ncbi:tyrosine-type recombinase/integrase [Actinoplanes sp. CA-030573]|uniref:tyrosine-type recombinase/integrase n=1 Tax=Actinoplanes sp. CA-030573 TaxID=3239898 RepID=UPI003D944517